MRTSCHRVVSLITAALDLVLSDEKNVEQNRCRLLKQTKRYNDNVIYKSSFAASVWELLGKTFLFLIYGIFELNRYNCTQWQFSGEQIYGLSSKTSMYVSEIQSTCDFKTIYIYIKKNNKTIKRTRKSYIAVMCLLSSCLIS